jgi:hypothetical protein
MTGSLLMTEINHPQVMAQTGLKYGIDVATMESENLCDPFGQEHTNDHFPTVNLCHGVLLRSPSFPFLFRKGHAIPCIVSLPRPHRAAAETFCRALAK